jgi:hypothetical protein
MPRRIQGDSHDGSKPAFDMQTKLLNANRSTTTTITEVVRVGGGCLLDTNALLSDSIRSTFPRPGGESKGARRRRRKAEGWEPGDTYAVREAVCPTRTRCVFGSRFCSWPRVLCRKERSQPKALLGWYAPPGQDVLFLSSRAP